MTDRYLSFKYRYEVLVEDHRFFLRSYSTIIYCWTEKMIEMIDLRSRIGTSEGRDLIAQLDYPEAISEDRTAEVIGEYQIHADQPIFGAQIRAKLVGPQLLAQML